MPKISIIIPSRCEKHLQKTIDSIFENAEGDVEVIVGLDGAQSGITIHDDSRIQLYYSFKQQIGQRAMIDALVETSNAQYIMKIDAHCIFSKGFDTEMLKDMDDKTILAPRMLCIDEDTWTPRHSPISSSYCFDTNLVFQYNKQAENKEMVNETMCLQGSAWMVARKTYWEWELIDESLGSWGNMGVELGIKAWINGGVCKTTKRCYYAHLFREKEEDFPYERDKGAIKKTRDEFVKRFKNADIKGLILKYDYPSDWSKEICNNL